MKNITTILLALLLLTAAKCQEPSTLYYYTELDMAKATNTIDSLKGEIQNRDSLLLIKYVYSPVTDTIDYTVKGLTDSLIITVHKVGVDVSIHVINEDKRMLIKYQNGERFAYMLDSTYTVGSLFVNSGSNKGFGLVDFDH